MILLCDRAKWKRRTRLKRIWEECIVLGTLGRGCLAKHLWNVHSMLFLLTGVLNVGTICWKVAFKRISPWVFLLSSVMSTMFSWCCGDILILKDLKLESQAGLQQRHILCDCSAEGSFEEVWSQTAVLGWFENSHSVFWKTPEQGVMYLLHLLTCKPRNTVSLLCSTLK